MNSSLSVATNLSNDTGKGLAILSPSKAEPIAHLADREGVSRQFLYRQKQKAAEALDEAFVATDGRKTNGRCSPASADSSPCTAKRSTAAGALHSPPQVGSSP